MAKVKAVAGKIQFEVETLDGGLNTKDSPSRIGPKESPDCLNVVFDDQGSCGTRQGTTYFSSSISETTDATVVTHDIEMGQSKIDGLTTYNGTMVAWAGGDMFRASSTTWVTIPSAQGQFSSGTAVAYEEYQDLLFCSDGTNGPYKYDGSGFYQMGIAVPSAPTGLSDTSGGGDVAADTYYYAVSYVNTQAVEGEVGSASVAVVLGASATVDVSSIPTGAASLGVDKRNVYRATAPTGPWLFVKELADNSASSFSDNIAVGSEGSNPPDDATAPTPFTTVRLHRERLFFDDADDRSSVRYTDYTTPFISQALNFEPVNKGEADGNIVAIGVQDDLVSVFKEKSIWLVSVSDPSDDATWLFVKAPPNYGIVGARAFVETSNGIIFVGKRNGRVTGFHLLSGIDVLETNNQLLRTRSISERIEPNIFAWPSARWSEIAMTEFNNRIYTSVPAGNTSTRIDGMMWFDIDRLGSDGQPGSWSPWTGQELGSLDFTVLDGVLYGGSSDEDGQVLRFNNSSFTDANGDGIDSYFWSKEIGGSSPSLESWIKTFRYLNLWYNLPGGTGNVMRVLYRVDGDQGTGTSIGELSLLPTGSLWGTAVWGIDAWGAGSQRKETQMSFGCVNARRLQFRFDNKYASGSPTDNAGFGFKTHFAKLLMNLRRERTC